MKKRYLIIFLFFMLSIAFSQFISSCYYDNEEELYPTKGNPTTCDTSSYTFSGFASPLILNSCGTSGCHSSSSQSAGVNLSSYTAIKNYITTSKTIFLGTIKHQSGFSQMPKGGSKLSNCNIQKLELWINKGMPNN
jgi:hypothetical protein